MVRQQSANDFSSPIYIGPFLLGMVKLCYHIIGSLIMVENKHRLINLPEPIIIAANHNSSFETSLLAHFLMQYRNGKKVSFLTDWMYQHAPINDWLMNQLDPIFVYNKPSTISFINRFRKSSDPKYACNKCIRYLQNNLSIVILPEGTRNRNPNRLKVGRRGIGEIILQTSISVLPSGTNFPVRIEHGKIPKF
ncbi:1-acyl-sn-glycerol-3-phosphate acyltransferase [candidate division KSB1 bacterium]|nr:1-acyl-sn-glycerol-3-phosphate acyltransferase [candidate division KSB1 bacterium]